MKTRSDSKNSAPGSLLIKPVCSDCNLACDYCFYSGKGALYPETATHRMPPGVLERMIQGYLALRLPASSFCWQGGEPTLAGLDFYERVVQLQMKHGRSGQVVGNSLQTNGVLLDDDWARFLNRYKFLVGVSLDGPKILHDRYRRDRTGGGSFGRVLAGIEALRRHKVEFNVLAMVTAATVGRAREVYDFFIGKGIRHLQFIPCVETNEAGEKPAPYSITSEQYGTFLEELYDAWRHGPAGISVRMFDAILSWRLTGNAGMCLFNGRCDDYVVVEHNGDVYPCDFFVEPRWRMGNIMEADLLELCDSDRRRDFTALREKSNKKCRRCRWVEICHGGCTKHRLYPGHRAHEPTYLCSAYRRLFARFNADFRLPGESPRQSAAEAASGSDSLARNFGS